MNCNFSNHTLLCGWNDHACIILRELLAVQKQVVVIAQDLSAEKLAEAVPESAGSNIMLISGDATRDETLLEAGIMRAASAIILSSGNRECSADIADARAVLTALAVETLRPEIYSVLEIANPANEIHARRAHVDNVVFCDRMIADMIALCASQRGISGFISDILCNSDDDGPEGGAALRADLIDDSWNGRRIGELFDSIRSQGNLPLGVLVAVNSEGTEEWRQEINPKTDSIVRLPEKIVYIECKKKRKNKHMNFANL